MPKPPNILMLVTDQQRAPRHWPDDPGWLRELTPNDAELARTGLTFNNAFCNTAMCSPSRATLLTGQYPAQHGVTLTLTAGDLRPDRRHTPAVVRTMTDILREPGSPRGRVVRGFVRGALQAGQKGGKEPVLRPQTRTIAHVLRDAGYEVAYKGKWHLTRAASGNGWGVADAEAIERDHGFAGWEPPDAGENAKAENFGGGLAAWDERFADQAVRFLQRADLPEPFCLIVSLVNPHDVLGYPASYDEGGYSVRDFRELGVQLPPTVDEDLSDKPSVHTLMRIGMTAYLGPLRDRREQLDYVNFYAYLHRVVDGHVGRILGALGDPDDADSLRARTVVVRCSDHGEMGLAHGGLRQKMFNAYEESIHVPLVISNPALFSRPVETDAIATLADIVPTVAALGGASPNGVKGRSLAPLLAEHASPDRELVERAGVELAPAIDGPRAASVQDALHFTYDDHQAGTALADVPGQPNRIRAVRDDRRKYAVYADPTGRRPTEYEMYDLERDPDETNNLVDRMTGEPRNRSDSAARTELGDRLDAAIEEYGTRV
jgi:choline-sulfatase